MIIGLRPLQEAIEAGKEIDKVLLRKGLQGELYHQVMRLIRDHGIPFQQVPGEKLDRLTRANHQGVIAFLSSIVYGNLEHIISSVFAKGDSPKLIMCDEVTDVRNFGAVCRSAESFGFHAVIIPEKGSAQINEDAIKSSAGAIFNISICREKNIMNTARMIRESGIHLVAATEKASKDVAEGIYTHPICFIVGSEERGIRPDLLKISDELVRIPLSGKTSSLNVSVAAAIVMYEAERQRKAAVHLK